MLMERSKRKRLWLVIVKPTSWLDSRGRWRNRTFWIVVLFQLLLKYSATMQGVECRSNWIFTCNGATYRYLRNFRINHLSEDQTSGLIQSEQRYRRWIYSRRYMWRIRKSIRKRIAKKSRVQSLMCRLSRYKLCKSIFWWNHSDKMLHNIYA
jgi:hypothetical protein